MKTRFSPSPTGFMHLGNVRTALFSYLLALGQAGKFLLRIEDTDAERSEERFTQALMDDLQWLGLRWHEGPYYQSQRQDIYQQYYQRLEQAGQAYPCFCSVEQLALTRKIQRSQGKPPRYPGTCRGLSPVEIAEKLKQGLQPTLRFKVPDHTVVTFQDLVCGQQRFQTDDIGDFIIRRQDKSASFMYCNAIDDALMGVTDVLRGVDHLTNTPRQILILQALNLPVPHYGHIALITAAEGDPLSKREGSLSLQELRAQGYLPQALTNYLARLGHYYGHDNFMTLLQLGQEFRCENLSKSPAKFNWEQLLFWQKLSVAALTLSELKQWLGDEVLDRIAPAICDDFLMLIKPNIVFPADVVKWVRIVFQRESFVHSAQALSVLQATDKNYFAVALEAVAAHGIDVTAITRQLQERLGLRGKALFRPLRVAITGEEHGPELGRLAQMIGVAEVKRRLEAIHCL